MGCGGIGVSLIQPRIFHTSFGGGAEGSGVDRGSQDPAAMAKTVPILIVALEHMVIDELTLHPLGQAEF